MDWRIGTRRNTVGEGTPPLRPIVQRCFAYVRGRGRIFYFRPGHETYPTYHQAEVQQVIVNAARWAAPGTGPQPTFGNSAALEDR